MLDALACGVDTGSLEGWFGLVWWLSAMGLLQRAGVLVV